MSDVVDAARAEAGIGGVLVRGRQDVPAACAFFALCFFHGDRECVAGAQGDFGDDVHVAQFVFEAFEGGKRRRRCGDVEFSFERAANIAVFARGFQRGVDFFAHAVDFGPEGGVILRVVVGEVVVETGEEAVS